MTGYVKKRWGWLISVLWIINVVSCNPKKPAPTGTVRVRINSEPATLNAFLLGDANKTTILSYVQWSPLSIDPVKLDWTPVVAESLPQSEILPDGRLRVRLRLRDEASWDDEKPVTAADVVFSFKLLLCPGVNSQHLRNFYLMMEDVEADPQDPKAYTVTFKEPYFNAPYLAGDLYLFPEHQTDSAGILRRYKVKDMLEKPDSVARDTAVKRFAEWFNNAYNGRHFLYGCGPYFLKSWEADKRIILERKSRWWGDRIAGKPETSVLFQALPKTLVFEIIKDEQSAVAALRSGQIDLISGLGPHSFTSIDTTGGHFQKFTPNLMAYHALYFNLHHPALAERSVRLALAHLVQTDEVVRVVYQNLVYPAATFIHPSRKEFLNDTLRPRAYDPSRAALLLSEAGWRDTDGDGILNKVLNGRKTNLNFTILTNSGNLPRQQMAEMLREAARPLGIRLEVHLQELPQVIEKLRTHEFEIYLGGMIASVVETDPYQIWHSTAHTLGSNFSGFHSAQADSLIERYRTTPHRAERIKILKELQAIVYEETPVVFIVAEKDRIVASGKLKNLTVSDQRPGYWLGSVEVIP
jgi:peptide/nickel transport system substrate-binding protein